MLTGICTTDFEGHGRTLLPAEELFAKIEGFGFSCLQFAFSSVAESGNRTGGMSVGWLEIPPEIAPSAIRAILDASEKHHLPIRVINGTFNMAHPDPLVRQEGLRRFAILLDAAAAMHVPYVSLCTGTRCREHLWTYSAENDSDAAWNDMAETVRAAVRMAEQVGVTLAVESEASNVIDTPEMARRLLDEIGSPNLKMILDCANLFHRGEAYPENVRGTIAHAFEFYGADIVVAHGKDIRAGEGIDFCGTGQGIIDFGYTASLLRESGYTGDMFLHGIYSEADMPGALVHWKTAEKESL